eukprot:CAMPEP_0172869234 /NCGR_PEP_ID=MMETSP1075-20121228/88453_1 /TAXON_ID=2916 /ORGANISM="Ceratium fusus, Strain PA161109" /LENGTH=49 /DNA_ID=CAMNT_0013719085 /DNA_START=320 /DNA_END=469 /DNA_ORIENTATION=-
MGQWGTTGTACLFVLHWRCWRRRCHWAGMKAAGPALSHANHDWALIVEA